MSSFTEPLSYVSTETFQGGYQRLAVVEIEDRPEEVVALHGARRLVRIARSFVYTCKRTGCDVHIPQDYLTDLGSIPAFARGILSPDDPWAQAYVVHDWHYDRQVVPRETADLVLWDALGVPFRAYDIDGKMYRVVCPRLLRWAIWFAVRIGGRYRTQSLADERPASS
ncbi:DUF1353 domain-containing protein [Aurantimonas sp. MSK8Z-1]|uniref:DUF1353 domain-containing protein n=1 Tax=Mangrovibrevibacter kandeliae TaxID=2968473 RepID=UPI0022317E91|nr:DUF1353 domain-containing protein [Aurantimonas sp. MSK8Z-1]MCW4117130.1 DUF1353 domain-containing protein [Aurantimonas sp. MSK8Z-1]